MDSIKITEGNAINKQSFPVGSLISSRLPYHSVGDLLEVHEFLCCFQQVLGMEEPLSFEDLENDISWENFHYLTNTAGMETVGLNCSRYMGEKLTILHRALLPKLVIELLDKTDLAVNIKLDMVPINQLTWPEVVRRYLMAYLLTSSGSNNKNNNNKELIRCLQGDGGICCGSHMGVAGVDLDSLLLGRAVNKVFGTVKKETNTLSMGISDGSIPEWVKELDPVKKLPTNVGSRIRNCVYEALKKNPPEWAKKQLEASIAKEVYKGNASGPTKRAVIGVLKRAASEVAQIASGEPQRPLPPPDTVISKRSELISKIMMKKCRSVLRKVASAYDSKKDFSNLIGRNFKSDDNEFNIVFGSASIRPLDLRTIDFKLLHGTYGGSHEAFLEDVREAWINLNRSYMNKPRLVKRADKMSRKFKLRFENEVAILFRRLSGSNMSGNLTADLKELEELLASFEIPKAPWDTGICKVCGLNRDDKIVLLCDTEGCNAEYHTYCLNPPLSGIPESYWYCPTCAPPKLPESPQNILQFVDKSCCEEASQFLDIATAMQETEYWELGSDKKILLLKFLCDKLLNTRLIHENIDNSRAKLGKVSLRKEFLGIDSNGRLYWGFPDTCTHCGIVVDDNVLSDSGTWSLFQTHEDIYNLIDYLKTNDPNKVELRDSILQWQKAMLRNSQRTGRKVESNIGCSPNCLATKATKLLQAKYVDSDASKCIKTPGKKNMVKWHRCDCLEPIFPSRYHCVNCHETFFTNVEFKHHKNSTCEITLDSGQDGANRTGVDCLSRQSNQLSEVGKNFAVPESSLKPLVGNTCHILRQLKINLLDMEAALPDGAKRRSRASPEWRSAWCAFVKSANKIYEMVEATLVLETMIKTEYINNTWWWYWSWVSVAAKTSTMSALALRIYTLDAAINYEKKSTTSSDQKKLRKRKQTFEKSKESEEKMDGVRHTVALV